MNVKGIGKNIAVLRKNKGIKQEELAKYVGISTQAVSKWENGGVPDIELLPKIADFFNVTVDELFGRSNSKVNITAMIFDHIKKTKPDSDERFKAIFELCWDIERSIFNLGSDVDTEMHSEEGGKIKDYEAYLKPDEQQYSSILSDHGFTRTGIANRLQYFLMVPEIKDKQKAIFDNINYIELFNCLSDKEIFDSLLLLFKRDNNKSFTKNLFMKELGVSLDKAEKIIEILTKYQLIKKTQIELDDEIKDVYTFLPSPSFVSMLIFAREIIDPPHSFAFYSNGRNKPYLSD